MELSCLRAQMLVPVLSMFVMRVSCCQEVELECVKLVECGVGVSQCVNKVWFYVCLLVDGKQFCFEKVLYVLLIFSCVCHAWSSLHIIRVLVEPLCRDYAGEVQS